MISRWTTRLAAVLAIVASALTAQAASARPKAGPVTLPVTDVAPRAATFNGLLTPRGQSTRYFFAYAAGGSEQRTALTPAGDGPERDGPEPVAVSARADGLSPATEYRVRLVALAGRHVIVADEVAFTTPAEPPAALAPQPIAPPPGTATPQSSPASTRTGTPPVPTIAFPVSPPPAPLLGQTVTVSERWGAVRVKVPGATRYVALTAAASVPVGSLIDARRGSVTLRTAVAGGRTQVGIFHGGLFEVRQRRLDGGMTENVLRGAPPACTARASAAAVTTRRRPPRRLWGRTSKGRFRTRGGNSVAAVRGTAWYVEDRCDGTLTRVSRGVVAVRDLVRGRTVLVRAGHRYLARKR